MEGFQKAICDLVASPELTARLTEYPEDVLAQYDLTDRDRRRLMEVVQQPGMTVNHALYRVNRLSPIYSLMPNTCFLLDDRLMDEAIEFWKEFDETRLQFNEEVENFGNFLRSRVEAGVLHDLFLPEILEYELALNEFRFMRRAEVASDWQRKCVAPSQTRRIGLHPLVRILLFEHDPRELLPLLEQRRPLPYSLADGEFWLLLDGKGSDVEVKVVECDLGRLLHALGAGIQLPLNEADAEMLTDAGLTVRLS